MVKFKVARKALAAKSVPPCGGRRRSDFFKSFRFDFGVDIFVCVFFLGEVGRVVACPTKKKDGASSAWIGWFTLHRKEKKRSAALRFVSTTTQQRWVFRSNLMMTDGRNCFFILKIYESIKTQTDTDVKTIKS